MVLKSRVLKQQLKKKGYWNYSELYDFCFDWLKDNGYTISEKEYTEKNPAGGKELKIEWEAKKLVTDYFKNSILLRWHILRMNEAEIERDGVKESTNEGEVKIEFTADLIKDYEERWEDQPFWKFLRGIYDKYIIRTTADEYENRLEEDTLELISQIKAFLQIEGR
tara:strand:- start:1032 stop:1529 length:498 start_codon:yes stop_codon:yes gene_type:complete